jgi:hypothetical protein
MGMGKMMTKWTAVSLVILLAATELGRGKVSASSGNAASEFSKPQQSLLLLPSPNSRRRRRLLKERTSKNDNVGAQERAAQLLNAVQSSYSWRGGASFRTPPTVITNPTSYSQSSTPRQQQQQQQQQQQPVPPQVYNVPQKNKEATRVMDSFLTRDSRQTFIGT